MDFVDPADAFPVRFPVGFPVQYAGSKFLKGRKGQAIHE
jgi:hypothetical protein